MSGRDFVAGLEAGVLRLAVCRECGFHQTLDPFHCARCGSTAIQARDVRGSGVVYATTEVHRAPTDAFRGLAPYRLVLVDLDGGGRIMGHGEGAVAIGTAVVATVFHDAGLPLLRFVPKEAAR